MTAVYVIVLHTELRASMAEQGIKRLQNDTDKLKRTFNEAFEGGGGAFAIRGVATEVGRQVRNLTVALGLLGAAFSLTGRQAINMAAEFELLGVTLEILTGSVEEADQLLRDLKEFAATTPLQLRDVEEGATILLGLGEAAEDVIPILKTLGQAAVALNKPIEQFIRARNLLQQGIILSRTLAPLGISRQTLAEFGAAAGATGEELVAAFDLALGKFEGLFERTFNTIRGRLSNLRDQFELTFAALGDPLQPVILRISSNLERNFGNIRAFLEENREVVSESFDVMLRAGETALAPLTAIFDNFFKSISERPESLKELAQSITVLTGALAGLVIVGTIAAGFLNIVAAITLIRIALPQLLRTIAPIRALFVNAGAAIIGFHKSLDLASTSSTRIFTRLRVLTGNLRILGARIGSFIAPVALVIGAFRNWRSIADALVGVWHALSSAFSGFLSALDSLVSLIPGIRGTFDLLSRGLAALDLLFIQVFGGIELLTLGISHFIEKGKELIGLDNDLQGSLERLDEAMLRIEERTETAIAGILGLSRSEIEAGESTIKFGEAMDRAVNALGNFESEVNALDLAEAAEEINKLTDAFLDLSVTTKQVLSELAVAQGLIEPLAGPVLPGELPLFRPGPLARQLAEEGFDVADVLGALVSEGTKLDRRALEELLGLDQLSDSTGRARRSQDELTDEQKFAIARLQEWNNLVNQLNDAARLREAQIENQNILGITSTQIASQFNQTMLDVIQGMLILNEEQELQADNMIILNSLLDQFGRQLKFEPPRPGVNADIIRAQKELEQAIALKRKQVDIALAEEEEQRAYDERQKLADLRRREAEEDAENLAENRKIFENFIRDLSNEFSDFVMDWVEAGEANTEALSAAMGELIGQFAISRMPGLGIFRDPVGAIIGGLTGYGLSGIFGTEKALKIEGPVDVNIVDIQANAANFFGFRGFEGFTFTSRFKTVFESGLT